MRSAFGNSDAVASEIQGQFRQGTDKIVGPPKWAAHARLEWPEKTAAHIAAIAGRDERTALRWLSGEFEPPLVVMLVLINKMFER